MHSARLPRLDLRRLIILLAMLSGLVTLSIGFYASYKVQRESLIDSTLEANRAYAAKLANSTELFFRGAQQQLSVSAESLAARFDDRTLARRPTASGGKPTVSTPCSLRTPTAWCVQPRRIPDSWSDRSSTHPARAKRCVSAAR